MRRFFRYAIPLCLFFFSAPLICKSKENSDKKNKWKLALSERELNLIKDVAYEIAVQSVRLAKKGIEGGQYSLRELIDRLPVINKIPIPSYLEKFLDEVKLRAPKYTHTDDGTELKWVNPIVYGQEKADLTFRLYVGKGDNDTKGLSFGVSIPGTWTLNDLVPEVKERMLALEDKLIPEQLKAVLEKLNLTVEDFAEVVDLLEFENLLYVTSSGFEDPLWGPLEMGGNINFKARTKGDLKKLTDVFGKDLTEAEFRGFVTFGIAGSEARAITGGNIDLLRFPIDRDKPAKFHLRTAKQEFRIGFTPGFLPTIKAIGGYELLLPGQDEYIRLLGSADFLGIKGDISLYSEGKIENLFGMKGVDVGELGVVITLIPFEEPIGGFGIKTEIHLGKLKMSGVFRVDVSGDLAVIGSYTGGLSQKDLADLALYFIKEGAKIGDVEANVDLLRPLFYATLPKMEIGDLELYIVPVKSIELFDKIYPLGIYAKASASFLGVGGGFEGELSYSGFRLMSYIDEIKVPKKNPVFMLTGEGKDGKRGTDDDAIIGALNLTVSEQSFMHDALLEIPPLGIKNDVIIKISPKEAVFKTKKKLFGALEMDLAFQTKDFSLEQTFVEGSFKQSALDEIGNLLSDQVKKANKKNQEKLKDAKDNLKQAQADIKRWEKKAKDDIDKWIDRETEKLQKPIDDLKAQIKEAHQRCEAAPLGEGRKIKACAEEVLTPARKTAMAGLTLARDVGLKGIVQKVAKSGVDLASFAARNGIETAKLSVKSAQDTLDTVTKVSDFLGKLAKGNLNIKSIKIKKSTLNDLIKEGTFPEVEVKGTILGREFCQVYQINLKKPSLFITQIAVGLIQIFGKKEGEAFSKRCGRVVV